MKKNLIIIFCIICFLNNGIYLSAADNTFKQEFEQGINNLFSNYQQLPDELGLINQINDKIIYMMNSQEKKLSLGTEFIITTQKKPIEDFLTGAIITAPEYKIAEAKTIASNEEIIVAKIITEKILNEPQIGDRALLEAEKLNLAIIDFNHKEITKGVKKEVDNKLYNYFATDDRFNKIDRKEVNQFVEVKDIDPFSQSELEAVKQEFGVDIILSGDIYLTDGDVYLKINLFDYKNNKTDSYVIQFSQEEKIIDYNLIRHREKNSYQKLFTSQKLDFLAYNIELIDLNDNQELEIIMNTQTELNVLGYEDENLYRKWIIEQYQIGDYDDYKFITTFDGIIAEKGNRIFEYRWIEGKYQEKELDNFFRNRPKNKLKKDGNEYLITRDYRDLLVFNVFTETSYEKDFSLEIAQNEGYRVEIVDLDQNNKHDIILTAFDREKEAYEILIYNFDYEFKYKFPDYYGPILLAGDLNQNQQQELFTVANNAEQIISFIWDGEAKEYKKNWESKEFEATIKDLAIGDLTADGKKDLLVLLSDDEQSWISLYQSNPYHKD